MLARIRLVLSNSKLISFINAILVLLVLVVNIYFQAFCIPTFWAGCLIIICFLNMVLLPILPNHYQLNIIEGFLNGISIFVFLYCIIFLEHLNFLGLGLILVGIGFAAYVPHIFLLQLLRMNFKMRKCVEYKKSLLSAIVICVLIIFYIGTQYNCALKSIESFKQSHYQRLDKTFMTERILGMHFIYHTRICEFDGWRPPKHDPILIIGIWLNNRRDPLEISLKERLELYKKFFPNKPYKFKCSCAIEGSNEYQNDSLWK